MTPAIVTLQKAKVTFHVHTYAHNPSEPSYGVEAAEKLGLSHAQVFKTLLVSLDNDRLAVGIIPVTSMLNMKKVAKVLGAKKVMMADKSLAERTTGYVLGGISPLGQKKSLVTVIDSSAGNFPSIFVSGGRRGLEIELAPDILLQLVKGRFADICQQS
ncbi:Cys-tRNA(Pro) deacylase [Alteromonas sediminis]|uniref:Cys-tRNA(Pro)/Cys-tRNA(Cys) deacylase n=1 Tax=Alteromonas sediminis TaxID=2259342 RepID=A0A3N5Z7D2_9ALTE|nr:Cys-tRNA(Pro) deacylase [Alteromonas sediminis]RPJ66574.1 Cys-tRNA(Pro) deacylase [Alteromonas sediminis]